MSESYIQLPPDSTGKKARSIERTVGDNVVHERAVVIVEPVSGVVIDPRNITSGNVVVTSGVVVSKVSGETVIAKVSGEVVATRPHGYNKAVVSGAVIANIVSGQVVLHTVTINAYTSGYYLMIWDSCSGAVGRCIGMVFGASRVLAPATLIFDCTMLSGIVVTCSGATWHATVTYRMPF